MKPKSLREQLESDAAFAFVEFGLRDDEFFAQTPREWQRRVEAWVLKEERANRRVARICMVLAWCHGDTDATEEQFIPKRVEEEEDQTFDEMVAVLTSVANSKRNG